MLQAAALRARFIELQSRLLDHYGVRAVSRHVQLRNPPIRAHVLEGGRGAPIVILHGGDGEAVDWAPLMAPLQVRAHLFAVDRPSCGLTDPFDYRGVDLRRHAATFVSALLDALELPRATLIGGALGGFFALATALAYPLRVDRLILVGMPVGITSTMPFALRMLCGVPGLAALSLAGPSVPAQRKRYETLFHVDVSKVPDLYFETRVAGASLLGVKQTWAVLLRRIGSLRGLRPDVDLSAELDRIEQPVLLLWGEREILTPSVGQKAVRRMSRARLVPLSGIGHLPFVEDPERCAELIESFLAEWAGPARGATRRAGRRGPVGPRPEAR